MTASSVNLVSRRPARPDGEPLTWGFNMSEGRLHQKAYPAHRS